MRDGVRIPWKKLPRPCRRKQKALTEAESAILSKEVARMLREGAIEETDRTDLVISSIYTVPKKNGKHRPVINLRWVNSHIHHRHFKMSTMKDVKAAMSKGCFMAKVDLSDCFWGVPVAERDRRFMAFQWEGKKYTFKVLPFGLSVSPYFITKLYRSMVEHLQQQGHHVIIYMDDILVLGKDRDTCRRSLQALRALLQDLGAVINEDKSSLTPTQRLDYLGFTLDSAEMRIWAPAKKMTNMYKALKAFQRKSKASARDAASLLGKLTSMADALFPVRVHTSAIHDFKTSALGQGANWDTLRSIPASARANTQWWLHNLRLLNGRPILQPKADIRAATDASDLGWGAWLETPAGKISWGGAFPNYERDKHINFKELLAVYYLIRSCPNRLKGKVVDLGIDNTTALHYIRNMGGRKTYLADLAAQIFNLASKLKIRFLAYHLPGEENVLADMESRRLTRPSEIRLADFKLLPQVFQAAQRIFGQNTIDAFATFHNTQMRRFGSWSPQPDAVWLDSMAHPWSSEFPWLNPPFAMLGRVLQKVEAEHSTATLVVPLWPAQPWFPKLLALMVGSPLILPRRQGLFLHPTSSSRNTTPPWITLVCKISGGRSRPRTTTTTPLTLRFGPGPTLQWQITRATGSAGRFTSEDKAKIRRLAMTLGSRPG